MPTYEFRCPDGHDFTRFYKTISAGVSELECPECGKLAARQLSGGAGLVFKGSGFYLTDYGKNAHRGSGPPKADAGKTEAGKSEGGKSEGGKSEGGKSEGGKAEGPQAEATKSETPKSDGAKAESAKPKTERKPAPKAKPE